MSEAELHVLKQRMVEGKRAKAKRGELAFPLPMGYIRRPSSEIIKDPDEQAQSTIQLVFDLFDRFLTINAVLKYLVIHKIQMPIRENTGLQKGELSWRRPNRPTLSNLFHNPFYALTLMFMVEDRQTLAEKKQGVLLQEGLLPK